MAHSIVANVKLIEVSFFELCGTLHRQRNHKLWNMTRKWLENLCENIYVSAMNDNNYITGCSQDNWLQYKENLWAISVITMSETQHCWPTFQHIQFGLRISKIKTGRGMFWTRTVSPISMSFQISKIIKKNM